jgi:hypothetical protein
MGDQVRLRYAKTIDDTADKAETVGDVLSPAAPKTAGTPNDVTWRRCWLLRQPLYLEEGHLSTLDDVMLQISS